MTSAKMYRNLHHREGAGWLAGLSTGQAVAVGAACVPLVVAVAADWPDWTVEDAAAGIENDAADRFGLLRLELTQDAAFAAACLPVGYGLPGLPNRRWQR